MRTCGVYKSMFFKIAANFKTSVKLESLAAVQLCEINSK